MTSEPRGSRVRGSLARIEGNDRLGGQATQVFCSSGRLALLASVALFVSGCSIDGEPARMALGALAAALLLGIVGRLIALSGRSRMAAVVAAEQLAGELRAERRLEAAERRALARCHELADECDRLLGPDWYRPAPLAAVSARELLALQSFGDLPR